MKRPGRARGFTLVEVIIAVAIVAILLSLAAPSYLRHGLRAHRADALGVLMVTAACQERLRAIDGHYDTGQCQPASSARYQFNYAGASAGASDGYTLRATPQGAQRRDSCGALSLSHDGARSADGRLGTVKCWNAL
ncbi:type IV pilin protein [Marinihelvus fidelis]|uniref:type IV pilin protein n=1 Tax=Marinihelvus fidelis TaxID=2613842 RepID=UPI00177CBC14|nr:type IV pilin protein [Marinihelvus fidelis]